MASNQYHGSGINNIRIAAKYVSSGGQRSGKSSCNGINGNGVISSE
jgi:hypothetical protein